MNKKFIIIAILTIFLTATFSSTVIAAKNTSEETQDLGLALIKSEISIEAPSQIDEPINSSNPKEIEITVKYKLDMGSLAWRFFFNTRIGRLILFGPGYIIRRRELPKVTINLSVLNYPDWCTAELGNSSLELDYNNVFEEAKTTLRISVNEGAPALKPTDITIKAEFAGHWTIKETSNTTTISFMPAYKSNITYEALTEYTIPPLENTTIPINITNNGNGETILNIEVEEPPEGWNISLDQQNITIPMGEMEQINIEVIPVKGFNEEIITLRLILRSTSEEDIDDSYLEGTPVTLSITVYNDGSLKEENGISGETLLIIAVVVILLVAVVIAYLFFKKKKQ